MKTIKLKIDFSNIGEFENAMNDKLKSLWNEFQDESANGLSYEHLKNWQNIFEPFGLSFKYGLDADAYNFKLKLN